MSFFESGQNEEGSAVQRSRNDSLIRRVARIYYEERLTKHAIATQLHLSQGTVSRLLQKAEEQKIVRTTISPPLGTFVDLEELLEQKFGLAQVIIARAPNDSEESAQGAIGAVAAHFLGTTLKSKSVIGVATWSASLLSMVEQQGGPDPGWGRQPFGGKAC